jgi:hypothetical protein
MPHPAGYRRLQVTVTLRCVLVERAKRLLAQWERVEKQLWLNEMAQVGSTRIQATKKPDRNDPAEFVGVPIKANLQRGTL